MESTLRLLFPSQVSHLRLRVPNSATTNLNHLELAPRSPSKTPLVRIPSTMGRPQMCYYLSACISSLLGRSQPDEKSAQSLSSRAPPCIKPSAQCLTRLCFRPRRPECGNSQLVGTSMSGSPLCAICCQCRTTLPELFRISNPPQRHFVSSMRFLDDLSGCRQS